MAASSSGLQSRLPIYVKLNANRKVSRTSPSASKPARLLGRVAALCLALLAPIDAVALPAFHILTEADPDANFEVVRIRSFDTLADVISLNQTSTSVLGPNIGGSAITISGVTFDGSQYHLITEADPDAGFEVVRIRSFNTLSDLINLNQTSTTVLGPNIGGSAISVRGFTYDGSQYHLITEADPDAGFEVVRIRSFNTLSDLIDLNQASTTVLGPNIGGSAISVAGLTYDGIQFHLVTEADPDAGFEVVRIRSFDTLADLINLNQASTSILGPNIGGSAINVRAFFYDGMAFDDDGDSGVPLPSTLALLVIGFIGAAIKQSKH